MNAPHRPMRRAGLALLCVGALFAAGAARAGEPVSLILNYIPTADHSPYYYARDKGLYAKAGIDLSIEVGKGSAFSAQSVAAGSTLLGIADLPTAFVADGKGADLVAVMNVYANSPQGFYWLKSSGIKGAKDFPGHAIGNPPGDAARIMWPAFAKAVGIDPASVHFVNVAPQAKIASLRTHAVDIISDFYNEYDLKAQEFGADLGFLPWRDVGINLYGNSIVATQATVRQKPDLMKRFVEVTQRAFAGCVVDVAPCLDALLADASGLNRKVQENQWNRIKELMRGPDAKTRPLGWFDHARIQSDYDLVSKYIGLEHPFDPAGAFTNDFLDQSIKIPPG
jgi:NitT/TauT family transport system substrate-binding protein